MHTLTMDWRHLRGQGKTRVVATPLAGNPVAIPSIRDVRRWHANFESAFTFGAMTCPAAQLADPAVAAWVRRQGVCVDVENTIDLDAIVDRGVEPTRIVVHGSETAAAPLRRGCHFGVGRYVIGSVGQAAVLAMAARGRAPVIIDVTDDADGQLEHAVLGAARLEAIGVRMRLPSADAASDLGGVTLTLIARMAHIRRRHGALLTRLNIGDLDMRQATRRHMTCSADAIEDALDDACARYRFPRPAVVISPLAFTRKRPAGPAA